MILLDTHIVLWWLREPGKLTEAALSLIAREQQDGTILISAVSGWEIAMLAARERVVVAGDILKWFDGLADISGVRLAALDHEILVRSVDLPGAFHKDPADRMIVATARKYGVPLVTADARIRTYPHVQAVW